MIVFVLWEIWISKRISSRVVTLENILDARDLYNKAYFASLMLLSYMSEQYFWKTKIAVFHMAAARLQSRTAGVLSQTNFLTCPLLLQKSWTFFRGHQHISRLYYHPTAAVRLFILSAISSAIWSWLTAVRKLYDKNYTSNMNEAYSTHYRSGSST